MPICLLLVSEFHQHCPVLHKLGVTSASLLNYADPTFNSKVHQLSSLPCVTNEIVLELNQFMNRNQMCTYYTLWQWLAALVGQNWPQNKFPTVKAIRQSVIRLVAKLSKLKKLPNSEEKNIQISSFLSGTYSLPSVFVNRHHPHRKYQPLDRSSSSSSDSSIATSCSSSCSSCTENEVLKFVNLKLCHELSSLNKDVTLLRGQEKKLSEARQRLYSSHRNLAKKLKRRDNTIQKHTEELTEGRKLINDLEHKTNHS